MFEEEYDGHEGEEDDNSPDENINDVHDNGTGIESILNGEDSSYEGNINNDDKGDYTNEDISGNQDSDKENQPIFTGKPCANVCQAIEGRYIRRELFRG